MNKTKPRTGKRAIGPDPAFESRSLAKGLQILEVLSKAGSPMPLKDLAETVGLGKASTLRLLRTLRATGYLLRDGNEFTPELEVLLPEHMISYAEQIARAWQPGEED